MITTEDRVLNIHIENNKPVEINNLSRSLNGLATLYKLFMEETSNIDIEPKLYIKEIKEGSIDIYLVGQVINFLGDLRNIADFAIKLNELFEVFKGKKELPIKNITKKECEALINFTDVTAKDVDARVGISVQENNGNIYQGYYFNYTTIDANAIQNTAKDKIKELDQQKPRELKQVEMYWADANFLSNKKHGKVIIEEISDKPISVKFLNDEDRKKCSTPHPDHAGTPWQDLLYTADIKALYVQDKLKGYQVTKLYDEVISLND